MKIPLLLKRSIVYSVGIFFIALLGTSCVHRKHLVYAQLRDHVDEMSPQDTLLPVNPMVKAEYRIQANNYLMIRLISKDEKLSNLVNGKDAEFQQNSVESTVYYKSHFVNARGFINLYLIGEVQVLGLTTNEIVAKLELAYKVYVKDPNVSVQLANNRLYVLGEVRDPGVKIVYDQRVSIFQALAMAGDITLFGRRDRVRLIRDTPIGIRIVTLDVNDPETLVSENYYLKPGDILYVEPMRARASEQNRGWIQVVLSGLSVSLLAFNIFTK